MGRLHALVSLLGWEVTRSLPLKGLVLLPPVLQAAGGAGWVWERWGQGSELLCVRHKIYLIHNYPIPVLRFMSCVCRTCEAAFPGMFCINCVCVNRMQGVAVFLPPAFCCRTGTELPLPPSCSNRLHLGHHIRSHSQG